MTNKPRSPVASPPLPPGNHAMFASSNQSDEPPPAEGRGRWSFRPMRELPAPNGRFAKTHKVYPSGERTGNGK
jgi:hypothetical protein